MIVPPNSTNSIAGRMEKIFNIPTNYELVVNSYSLEYIMY